MYLSTLTLLHSIKAESGEATAEEKFQANRGWVMKLKGRNPLHNIKIQVKWNEVLAAQCAPLFTTSWTVVCQAPLSMGFSR